MPADSLRARMPPIRAAAVAARGTTAADRVYQTLRDDIISLRRPPGQAISEKEVALMHGVSRTPVREALLRLAREELIVVFPQSGTFVARIPMAALPEAIMVRMALEELTVRRATENATADQVDALQRSIDEQHKLERLGDYSRFHAADEAFHAAIAEAAGHPGIWKIVEQVKAQVDRYRRLTLPVPGRMGRVVTEHGAVAAAIGGRDPDKAWAAMRHHLDGLTRSLGDVRDLNPEFFDAPPGEASR